MQLEGVYLGPGFVRTRRRMMTLLILLIAGASAVCSVSHTLRYYFTRLSDKGFGLPEFSAVVFVDDEEFILYDSESQLIRPLSSCVVKNEGSEIGDRLLQIAKNLEPFYRHEVRTLMRRLNQTGGFHSFQEIFGCVLRDDDSTAGNIKFGYDGRDFLYLDTQSWSWMPNMHEAEIITQMWNNLKPRKAEIDKIYLEDECIGLLKKYIACVKRVRPEVKVWGHPQSDGVTRLQCLVYGFHPRAVDVKWVRNGVDHLPSDEISPILPHPDGTYQIRVSVEVPTREGDTYSCHVDHSSLQETLSVKWELDNGPPIGMIVGAVMGCLLVAATICGIRKRVLAKRAPNTKLLHSNSNPEPTRWCVTWRTSQKS